MMTRPLAHFVLAIAVLASPAPGAAQPAPRWQIGTMPSFSTGTYGGDTRTEILQTAFSLRRIFTDGDVTVIVPMTCIRGDGSVTVVGGTPARTATQPARTETTTDRPGSSRTDGRQTAADSSAGGSTAGASGSPAACGPGDVVVRGRRYLLDENNWWPTLALRAHVKVPTADAARGLGTGRPDEGVGVEISRSLTSRLLLLADAGFTRIGRLEGFDLQDRWWYDAGLSHRVSTSMDFTLLFEEQRAIVRGLDAARSLIGVWNVAMPTGWRVLLAGEVGLSDAAPDHGVSIGASRRF
jgi:hypothetical protein